MLATNVVWLFDSVPLEEVPRIAALIGAETVIFFVDVVMLLTFVLI